MICAVTSVDAGAHAGWEGTALVLWIAVDFRVSRTVE